MGQQALLLYVSCSALLVAPIPALLRVPKPALLLGLSLVVVGSHMPILIKVPVLRGTQSLLWQDVPIKLPRNTSQGGAGDAGSYWTRPRCKGTTCKNCQQSGFMLGYVKIILQIRTRSTCSIITLDYSKGGTRLAMPKTRVHTGLIVIEAWFRGY